MPKTVLRIEASCITRCATPEKLLELLPVWRPPRDCFGQTVFNLDQAECNALLHALDARFKANQWK